MDDFFGKTSRNTAPDRRASTSAAPVSSNRGKKRVRFRLPPSPSPSPEPPLDNGTMPDTRLVRRGGKFTPRVIRVTRSTALKDEPNNPSGSGLSPADQVKRARTSTSLKASRSSVPVGALNVGSSSDLSTVIEASQRTWSNSQPGSRTMVEAIDNSCPSAATTLPSPESQVKSSKAMLPPNLSQPIDVQGIPSSSAGILPSSRSQVGNTKASSPPKLSPQIEALNLSCPKEVINDASISTATSPPSKHPTDHHNLIGNTAGSGNDASISTATLPQSNQPTEDDIFLADTAGSGNNASISTATWPPSSHPTDDHILPDYYAIPRHQSDMLSQSLFTFINPGNGAPISIATSPPSSHPTEGHILIGNTAGSGNDAPISTATWPPSSHPTDDHILPDYYAVPITSYNDGTQPIANYHAIPSHLLSADMRSESLFTFNMIPVSNSVNQFGVRIIHP